MSNNSQRILVGVLMAILGTVGGFVSRGVVDRRDVADSGSLVVQSRAENRDLKAQLATLNVQIAVLKSQLATAQDALNTILPSENTYALTPNKSVAIAGGRLNLALVGSPTNEEINLNINGKRYSVPAGEELKIAEASTECDVRVRSFDMFKALITATCRGEK
jgi:hypothetical protein